MADDKRQDMPDLAREHAWTLREFAQACDISEHWARRLVLRGHVPSRLVTEPIPYYLVPRGTEVPRLPRGPRPGSPRRPALRRAK